MGVAVIRKVADAGQALATEEQVMERTGQPIEVIHLHAAELCCPDPGIAQHHNHGGVPEIMGCCPANGLDHGFDFVGLVGLAVCLNLFRDFGRTCPVYRVVGGL